jgi:hypothetical protein
MEANAHRAPKFLVPPLWPRGLLMVVVTFWLSLVSARSLRVGSAYDPDMFGRQDQPHEHRNGFRNSHARLLWLSCIQENLYQEEKRLTH